MKSLVIAFAWLASVSLASAGPPLSASDVAQIKRICRHVFGAPAKDIESSLRPLAPYMRDQVPSPRGCVVVSTAAALSRSAMTHRLFMASCLFPTHRLQISWTLLLTPCGKETTGLMQSVFSEEARCFSRFHLAQRRF